MIPSESSLSSSSDNNSSKVSPSLARVSSLKGKNTTNSKSQVANNHSMSKSISRDSVKLVNEKMLENGHGSNGAKDDNDDSEDEKLSPLLNNNNKSKSQQALHESVALKMMDGVDENIDDDGDEDDHRNEVS